jgi:hypothetical protein
MNLTQYVGKEVVGGWTQARWKPISLLVRTEKATEAILALLKKTGVDKMPAREAPEEYGEVQEGEVEANLRM